MYEFEIKNGMTQAEMLRRITENKLLMPRLTVRKSGKQSKIWIPIRNRAK